MQSTTLLVLRVRVSLHYDSSTRILALPGGVGIPTTVEELEFLLPARVLLYWALAVLACHGHCQCCGYHWQPNTAVVVLVLVVLPAASRRKYHDHSDC
eukprot:2104197-Rhodomonas_salina.1